MTKRKPRVLPLSDQEQTSRTPEQHESYVRMREAEDTNARKRPRLRKPT